MAMTAGCHKKVAMTTPPPPPAEVRSSPPAPAPERQRAAVVAATPRPEPAAAPVSRNTPKSLEDLLNQLLDAYFDYDAATLRTDAQSALNKNSAHLRELLKEFPDTKFTVEGNCDERGSAEYNLALGERRATSAKNYLVALGVDPNRIQTISYGKERPAVPGSDEAAWAQNRRDVTAIN